MKFCDVTIHMKATKHYFPVVLFIMLYMHVGSNFWVSRWNPKLWPIKQYLPVVLFIILYEVVLTFQVVNGIQKYDDAKIKLLWLHYFYNVIL